MDTGSSFLPSEIVSAFLWAQLENLAKIQAKRLELWNYYKELLELLQSSGYIKLINLPNYATNNAHMFYILCDSIETRTRLIAHLKENEIMAVFHYLSLHKSPYYIDKYSGPDLVNSDRFENTLLRLPLYYDLTNGDVEFISSKIHSFYKI